MKKKLYIFLPLMFAMVCSIASAQSMKMVVDSNGDVVGRYVNTNKTTYTIFIQDTGYVSMNGHSVVTFRADKGQGIVYRDQSRTGNINVRKGPSTSSAVIAKIPEYDCLPDTFDCLGKTKGWYKIRIDGKVGYVKADLMVWDGMCSF